MNLWAENYAAFEHTKMLSSDDFGSFVSLLEMRGANLTTCITRLREETGWSVAEATGFCRARLHQAKVLEMRHLSAAFDLLDEKRLARKFAKNFGEDMETALALANEALNMVAHA